MNKNQAKKLQAKKAQARKEQFAKDKLTNEKVKKTELKCSNCYGTLDIDYEKQTGSCPFCGAKYIIKGLSPVVKIKVVEKPVERIKEVKVYTNEPEQVKNNAAPLMHKIYYKREGMSSITNHLELLLENIFGPRDFDDDFRSTFREFTIPDGNLLHRVYQDLYRANYYFGELKKSPYKHSVHSAVHDIEKLDELIDKIEDNAKKIDSDLLCQIHMYQLALKSSNDRMALEYFARDHAVSWEYMNILDFIDLEKRVIRARRSYNKYINYSRKKENLRI